MALAQGDGEGDRAEIPVERLDSAEPALKMTPVDFQALRDFVRSASPHTASPSLLDLAVARYPKLANTLGHGMKTLSTGSPGPATPSYFAGMSISSLTANSRDAPPQRPATARDAGGTYAVLNLEFESDAAAKDYVPKNGAKAFAHFQKWVDIFVPADGNSIVGVLGTPGLRWAEVADTGIEPPPPESTTGTRKKSVPERIVSGGRAGLTGKGVVVAVVDSGIDFHHPDFITYDAQGLPTSRIVAFWDTTISGVANANLPGAPGPISYPNGAPIGRIYSQADLTNELRSARPRIASWDSNGHGTACAGLAAGNGNASKGKFKGVAPDAAIIAVRVGGQSGAIENSYLLNAICGWVDKMAGKRPAVVSCSFGGQDGGSDGQRVDERQLSARFAPSVRGRAICVAAGNEGIGDVTRVNCTLPPSQDGQQGVTLPFAADSGPIYVYLNTSDVSSLRLGMAERLGKEDPGAVLLPVSVNPFTHQCVISVMARSEGLKALRLVNTSGHPVNASVLVGHGTFGEGKNLSGTIGTPGSALGVITVGSYDWNDTIQQFGRDVSVSQKTTRGLMPVTLGALSAYSSRGPLRTGEMKPEIVAPGQFFVAPYSSNSEESQNTQIGAIYNRDSTGFYRFFNGTSAATPYTSGVVALLLQKKPTLSMGELKALLRTGATRDQSTRQVPNPNWGFGKLNTAAVDRMIASLNTKPGAPAKSNHLPPVSR